MYSVSAASPFTWMGLDCAVKFAAYPTDSVAVSRSLLAGAETTKLPKVADPDAKFAAVVPPRNPALSVMETVLVGIAATTPLSVICTTGAGSSASPTGKLEGGSVVKAIA